MGNYKVKQEVIQLDDGSSTNTVVKVPNSQLERWDQDHDAAGRVTVHGVPVETKDVDSRTGQV